MSLPIFRNDSVSAQALRPAHLAMAIGMAWLFPLLLGGLFYGFEAAMGWLGDGTHPNVMFGTGLVLMMIPMMSWAGLLPGAALVWFMVRRGWGGFLPVLAAGFGLGWFIGVLVGGVSVLSIFSLSGLVLAGATWIALKLLNPTALVAPA